MRFVICVCAAFYIANMSIRLLYFTISYDEQRYTTVSLLKTESHSVRPTTYNIVHIQLLILICIILNTE